MENDPPAQPLCGSAMREFYKSLYPEHEDDAVAMADSLDGMMAASDVLFDGVRDVVEGGKAMLRATWKFHRAAWRLRKVPQPRFPQ